MSIQHGDETETYDPAIPADVDRIKQFIREKMNEQPPWRLYYRQRGEQTWKPLDVQDIDTVKADEVILGRDVEKMMTPPLTSG